VLSQLAGVTVTLVPFRGALGRAWRRVPAT
jgi:hypothetical protein